MLSTLATIALAADPVIQDIDDATYMEDSGRHQAAADWYLLDLNEHLTAYVDLLGQLPDYRSPALVQQVEQWRQDHPDDAVAGIALAMALSYEGTSKGHRRPPFHGSGPWCEPAMEALATLPDDPGERYRVLRTRMQVAEACGHDREADEAEAKALALSGDGGPYLRAWFGLEDGVDDDDLAAITAAVAERPCRIQRLRHAFAEEREGPALDAVRAYLLEQARTMATSDRPSHVAAAASLLSAADQDDEAHAAYERLAELDPGNERNQRYLARKAEPPSDDEAEEAPVDPTTIVDPAERLAALRQAPVPTKRWERAQHWSAIADAAEAVGDIDAELDALEHLGGSAAAVRYARTTVRAERDLKKGAKAAEHAVDSLRAPRGYRLPRDANDEASWRRALANALDARALVAEARGRRGAAADDLEEALRLDGPEPMRLLRLGLLYDDERGAPLLARAASELPPDTEGLAVATERIAAWLATQPGWQPDAATYIAAAKAPDTPAAQVDEALDNRRFVDLTVRIDGEERRLFDIEGPIVVDVWATWCGPCMGSLPHLDALTRRYEGEVTFLALSVDREEATAERYLERRGEHAFTAAFLGADGMDRLGVSGIPAMFVFDAEHRLVAKLSGWGPGSTQLDDAVERMMGR